MGPPWLALSTSEGKARGPGPWPLNHTNCLFIPLKEASLRIEPKTKPLRSTQMSILVPSELVGVILSSIYGNVSFKIDK